MYVLYNFALFVSNTVGRCSYFAIKITTILDISNHTTISKGCFILVTNITIKLKKNCGRHILTIDAEEPNYDY